MWYKCTLVVFGTILVLGACEKSTTASTSEELYPAREMQALLAGPEPQTASVALTNLQQAFPVIGGLPQEDGFANGARGSIFNGNGSQFFGSLPLNLRTYTSFYWHYSPGWVSNRYPNQRYISVITYQTSGSVWSGIRTKEFHWHVTTVRNEWGRLCIYAYEVNTYYERWWGCGNSSRPRYAWVSDLGSAFQQMLSLDGVQISPTTAYAMVYLVLPVMVAGGLLALAA